MNAAKLSALLIVLFIAQSVWGKDADQSVIAFRHLSLSKGLTNNSVTCLYRDSRGYLWIGTNFGLNRSDAYSIEQYYSYNSNLLNNGIKDLFEDHEGDIWVNTFRGFSIYDYKTGKFDNDRDARLKEYGISVDRISSAGTDKEKKYLWLVSHDKLYLYNHIDKVTKVYPLLEKSLSYVYVDERFIYTMYSDGELRTIDINFSQSREVNIPEDYRKRLNGTSPRIYVDSDGGAWIYTLSNSLLFYKKSDEQRWREIVISVQEEPFNRIRMIEEDVHGNMWLITSHLGAFVYNPKSNSSVNLVHDDLLSHSIASDNLNALHIDREGIVWIGNFKQGVSYYVPYAQTFLNYEFPKQHDMMNFYADEKYLWCGTDGRGLVRYSLTEKHIEEVPIPANVIVTMKADSKKRIWLGTYQNGLICYDKGKVTQYTTTNSQLLDNDVYGIQEDEHGFIWIGTLYGNIQRLNPETGEIISALRPTYYLNIKELLYVGEHVMYAATSQGLLKMDTQTLEHEFINTNRSRTQDLPDGDLYTVYKDSRNILWLGGTDGLTYWNLQTDSVGVIEREEEPVNRVKAIIEDNNKQMWVGTSKGLLKINLSTPVFSVVRYGIEDGIVSIDVNERALFKAENGKILMGTPKGIISIIPQEIIRENYDATVHLTNIENDYPYLMEGSPEYTTEIILDEDHSIFQLQFSTLDFIDMDKTGYAYKIRGINDDWVSMSGNKINFTILSAGNYDLQVKACNAAGVWSPHVKHLKINILPPWWRTWWAYTIYSLGVLCTILYILRFWRQRQKEKQMLQIIEIENEKQQKISDMKLSFFANVSHELRTPLALIINPLEEFFVEHPEYREGMLSMVKQNANYLLELVNQLLDFRRLDADAETLRCRHDNVLILVNEVFHSFDLVAQKRGIRYAITCAHADIYMDFDYDKLRKVCFNILSNAFKFTPDNGSISLDVKVEAGQLKLLFADTGCGISDESKNRIFERFYQVDENPSEGGSGIGLHLVSEYTKMHQGGVFIEDNTPCGALFKVILPLHQSCEKISEIEFNPVVAEEEKEHSFTILLVDDNTDFLNFLTETLSKSYRILKAINGRQALNVLEGENVDLILSDVMMPEMDGLQLCSTVKADIRYSHIPIILLTAKSRDEHQMEGLNVGADDYITKPFNMEILKLRINKIIEHDKKRQEIFSQQIRIEPSKIAITSLDQQFIEKAIRLVEENLDNVNFSVDELAGLLGISRGYLYKKLMKITGKASLEFIRTIRMKRAQQLLSESGMQIAEIAYMLGYNSPRVFTKHYKEEFGMTPSEYLHTIKAQEKGNPI